jgi:hypothetical protein
MKLYAVVIDNLGDRKSFAVRADNPAAAVRLVLDADGVSRNFQALQVFALEELAGVSEISDSVNGAEGLASAGGEA